jgi:phage shock protein C
MSKITVSAADERILILGERLVEYLSSRVGFVQTTLPLEPDIATLIVLVSDRWAELMADPANPHRIAIGSALERKIRVIPVLINGTAIPTSAALPPELIPLTRRTPFTLSEDDFRAEAARLVETINKLSATSTAENTVSPQYTKDVSATSSRQDPLSIPSSSSSAPTFPQPTTKRLARSTSNKMISGVLGGLGNLIGVDATLLRLIYAIATLLTGVFPGVIIYVIFAVVMPKAET